MGFIRNLLKKKKENTAAQDSIQEPVERNEYVKKLIELQNYIDQLLNTAAYIPKSQYRGTCEKYKDVAEFYNVLKNSGMLNAFCTQNKINISAVQACLDTYLNIENNVDKHNDEYITNTMACEKEYLDNILKSVDSQILLDEDQRRVILTDEDYCLIIAGAGAGKTTTVAAKVKYLVEKRNIDPAQILVVSFTNKAVNELREKINAGLKIECPIATFHSTGNAIIHKNTPDEKLNIVEDSKMYFVIRDYFRNSIMQNERLVNNLIRFFASYFDAPYEGDDINVFFNQIAKANFSTMRSELEDFKREVIDTRTKKSVTIQNEVLRSRQEVEIANYLYLNQIEYEYEPIYPYDLKGSRKPYTPDFIIKQDGVTAYLEHFGITEDGKNDRYSDRELEAYKRAVKDKIQLHREHGTTLIYTFSKYKDARALQRHLRETLEENGFEIRPRSNAEVLKVLIASEENRYVRKLINLICRFIANFKVNGYTSERFNSMRDDTPNVRTKLFLDICNDCYLEYERYLKENKAVDFQDMINESARILKEVNEMKQKLDFKYVIVDEYQDISRQRFDLTQALSEVTDAKIIAVGDDWQSIYAFSGSDITLFTKFQEKMGYARLLKIVKTYRNSQEVIDIAGNFIQKNTEQISKRLESPKKISEPVIIYTYDSTYKGRNGNRRSGANYATAHAVETALEQILAYGKQEGRRAESILLLGRFGFDGDQLEKSGLFEYIRKENKIRSVKYPGLDITFMTAHSSKGLGYDEVIVLNGKNETYGFPSKIEDDPVLGFVIRGDRSIDYAEERRLFYVAMTRTKNRVYFIAPEQNPSEFLLELKRDYKNVVLRGNWNEEEPKTAGRKMCPVCGYPMQYKYKNAYGLRLYICTNEPEVCGFMTNEYKAGKLSILKCDQCRDGYLIVKYSKKTGYFLGCTNYKNDGTGCKNTMSKKQFYDKMSYEPDPIPEEAAAKETEKAAAKETEKAAAKETEKAAAKETQEDHKRNKNKENNENKNNVNNFKNNLKSAVNSQAEDSPEDNIQINKGQLTSILYNGKDLNHAVHVVLVGLQHVSNVRFYGVTMLVNVLTGTTTPKVLEAKLNGIPEFGKLDSFSKENLKDMIEWLIENDFILKTKSKYPVLHLTYHGLHYDQAMTGAKLRQLKKYLEQ